MFLRIANSLKRGIILLSFLSVWRLHVLPVFVGVSSGCSGFSGIKNMYVRLILLSVPLTMVLA